MYCGKCGNELKQEDMFCNKCGNKVDFYKETEVYDNKSPSNENQLGNDIIITKFVAFILAIALIVGFVYWQTKQDDIRGDKIWIADALEDYCIGTITVDDFEIEKESISTESRVIYRIIMKDSSKLILDGPVYVGLVKRSGSMVNEAYVSTDLNDLYKTMK